MPDESERVPIGLRSRIRYRFDNLLAKGTWAVLLWLGAVTLLAVLVSSILLAIFGQTFSGSENGSWLEDFWQSLLRLLDTGTMAGDVGWGRRLLALLVTVVGILLAGTLIGIIAAGVEQRVEVMREGRSTVIESGHVVILGASYRLPVLVEQVAVAGRESGLEAIVVLAPRDSDEDHLGDLHTGSPALNGLRLVVRRGDSTRLDDLRMVAVADSRAVIALAGASGDSHVVNSVLAAGIALGGFGQVPVVAELSEIGTALRLVSACGDGVHPMVGAQSIGRIAAFVLRERGLNQVMRELLDFRGADLRLREPGELLGMSFAEAVLTADNARPLGRVCEDGSVEMNLSGDTRFEANDRVVVLAEHDEPLEFLSEESSPVLPAVSASTADLFPGPQEEHVLVVGWSELGAHFLERLAVAAAPGSSVEIVVDPATVDADSLRDLARGSIEITVTADADAIAAQAHQTALSQLTSIAMLASHETTPEEADSRTLLDLLLLRRTLAANGHVAPRVFVELRDPESGDLVSAAGIDDFVVSDAITSRLLGQLAMQPERRAILLSIDGTHDVSIHLVAADALGLAGQMRFADTIATAYAHGLLAIGVRRPDGELLLNPHASQNVTLSGEDKVVVVG